MRIRPFVGIVLTMVVVACAVAGAQSAPASNSAAIAAGVPHVIKISGQLAGASGTVALTFSLYAQQTGGAPLWIETQNAQLDATGRYTVLLGANHSAGVPAELFTSGEVRWLGVQADGQPEQARTLLVSVPYAVKAGDATTLGGLPPSAYMLARVDAQGNYVNTAVVTAGADAVSGTGSTGRLVKWADTTGTLTDSLVSETASGVAVGGAFSTTDTTGIGVIPYGNVRLNVGGNQVSGDNAFGMYMGSLTLQPAND
jgi:hypothetical protein